jgi:hypothetical protein
MCTTVGFVVSAKERAHLEALVDQWAHEQERSIHVYSRDQKDLSMFLEGIPEDPFALKFEIGAVGSGCSCGLVTECGGPNGEPPCDPKAARADVCSLMDLICSVPFNWLRFGFTDRYYDLTVVPSTRSEIKGVITSGEFPDDMVFHVHGE